MVGMWRLDTFNVSLDSNSRRGSVARIGKEPSMTSRQSRCALLVIVACLIIVSGCHEDHPAASPTAAQAGPVTLSLAYNGGQCTQNGSSGVIDVELNQNVTYIGPSSTTPFYVPFSSCPFAAANCPVNSPNGGPQNPGTPTGATANTTYYYGTVTVGGQSCSNGPQTFGIRIKPISQSAR